MFKVAVECVFGYTFNYISKHSNVKNHNISNKKSVRLNEMTFTSNSTLISLVVDPPI